MVDLCRQDVNVFCEFVLRDDETQESITQLDFHIEMQEALDRYRHVVVMAHPESGKSNQAIGRVLYELGRNPDIRIMLIGNSQEAARKALTAIKKYIERSEELHLVFPELRKGDIWQDVAITVQRPSYSKDLSVLAVGLNSNNVLGSRVDLMVFDDILNLDATSTEAQRRKVSSWVRTTALTRCTADARIWFLTNAWHPRDLAHELVKERGWHMIKRPIRMLHKYTDSEGRECQVLRSVWPERWPEKRIKAKEVEVGSLDFARTYMCEPRDQADIIFRPEFFVTCKCNGISISPQRELKAIPPKCVVVSGVDIGGRRVAGALTVIATVFFHPNGVRQPLWVEAGRWGVTEMIRRIVDTGQRYGGIIAVENNGVQQHIVDLARENSLGVVPVVPYYTGMQKADPRFGVASMASEFEAGRWVWPTDYYDAITRNAGRELEATIVDMLDYAPEQHTGDRLMALWIAREVGRRMHAYLGGDISHRPVVDVQSFG